MNIRIELTKQGVHITDADWSQRGSTHYLRVGEFIIEGTGPAIIKYAKAQKKRNIPALLELIQSKTIQVLKATRDAILSCGLP